ncbi:hypothetical protein [Nitrosomonas communis]|uniref:hypothetical protein n=1 Tax=Nitrosomonas communis TaxID=44574 RepID=UPI003D2ACA46
MPEAGAFSLCGKSEESIDAVLFRSMLKVLLDRKIVLIAQLILEFIVLPKSASSIAIDIEIQMFDVCSCSSSIWQVN